MEILVVIVVAAVIWLIASGTYKSRIQDPATLRQAELENAVVELKEKILVTSAYTAETAYTRLYERLSSLMGKVLERHQHFVLDVEAKGRPPIGFFLSSQHFDVNGMRYTTYQVPQDLDPDRFDPALLIYACFFLWHGGQAKNIGPIDSDPKLMLRILDRLIEVGYGPAMFMKGMVLKYGQRLYSQCFPHEARVMLERAQAVGVGSAAVELEFLANYSKLEGIKSVQLGE